jgi:hypothetical protein
MSAVSGNVYPKAKANVVRMDADGETILYDVATLRTHVLTETSAFVLDLCDGKTSVADIKSRLSERNADIADDVAMVALHRLTKAGLVEGFTQKPWESITTRRDTLKRIAMLGGAMMIPRIISVRSAQGFLPAAGGSKCSASLGCQSGYICCNQGNSDPSNCQCEGPVSVGSSTCDKFGKTICTR